MPRTAIKVALMLTLLWSSLAGAVDLPPVEWTLGLALEARLQPEVNPQYYGTKPVAGLFARARRAPWSGLLEWNQEGRETASGFYSVTSRTRTLAVWARYEPWEQGVWRPYAAGGAGVLFDQVETSLGGDSRTDHGRRLFVGGAVGVSRTFAERAVVEVEARAASVEQVLDPALSGWMRLGFSL